MPVLDWIGKRAVVNHHREVPYRLMNCDKSKSSGDPDAGNLLVQGDNLEALKALLPYYASKVKCVYIDPPFNTGNEDWRYNDNVSSPEIAAWLGETVGKEAEDLSRHDKWLCMMYPRLRLLKDFMHKSATLFIHIDDNELAQATMLCDEIFDRRNRCYVVSFKQGAATGHKAINPGMVSITNFILVYARSKADWTPNKVFTGRERDKRYVRFINNPEESYAKWQSLPLAQAFAKSRNLKPAELKKALGDAFEDELNQFVVKNAARVIRTARPDYEAVSEAARKRIDESKADPEKILKLERGGHSDMYFQNGERLLFYSDKIKVVDGVSIAGEPLTTLWGDILSNNLHNEGGFEFLKGKKPEALIKRCLDLSTSEGDLVLDSFAGSGTTAAVAHKMRRQWITVEMEEHAATAVAPRLKAVVQGEDVSGITGETRWKGGGGFRFCTLGEPLFDAEGNINSIVSFADLAAHVFFCDTGSPIPKRAEGSNSLIGTFQDRAIYLLFSPSSLGLPRAKAGNILTAAVLKALPSPGPVFAGTRVVYGEGCTLPDDRLAVAGVTFKQVPYQIEGI